MNLFLLSFVVFSSVATSSRGQPNVSCHRDFREVESVTFEQLFNHISENGWNETLSYIYCYKLNEAHMPQKFPHFPELSAMLIICYLQFHILLSLQLDIGWQSRREPTTKLGNDEQAYFSVRLTRPFLEVLSVSDKPTTGVPGVGIDSLGHFQHRCFSLHIYQFCNSKQYQYLEKDKTA